MDYYYYYTKTLRKIIARKKALLVGSCICRAAGSAIVHGVGRANSGKIARLQSKRMARFGSWLLALLLLYRAAFGAKARGGSDAGAEHMGITFFKPGGHYIMLTFDDGPHPLLTPKLLDVLKARKARCTFFVTGNKAFDHPDILKRMVSDGHEVASHGWSHTSITLLPRDELLLQLRQTSKTINDIVKRKPTVYRPPYGNSNQTLNALIATEMQMKVVLWSLDSLDWENRDAAFITKHIVSRAKPGDVILAHDTSPQMIAAVAGTIDALIAEGYELLTVSEIMSFPDDTPK